MIKYEPENNPFKNVYCDIVHRCNMECANCYLPNRDLPDIPKILLIDFFQRVKKPTEFRFIGGEPFMYKRIDEVIRYFDEVSNDIIKDSFIFDFYNNKKDNTVKLGYRIVLQSKTKTLSDEEITSIVQKIIEPILEMDGVTIPGMKLKRHNKD